MANTPRKRNPVFGLIMGLIFTGFGFYRLYNYYILNIEMASWRLLISYALIIYGLFVLGSLVYNRDAK
ncbi:MAG: hypothetical protein WBG46_13085 [Nonlabens sp.]